MSSKHLLGIFLLSAFVGGCAGAFASVFVVPSYTIPILPTFSTSTSGLVTTSTTSQSPELIKVEHRPFSFIPPELLRRRASPVAHLYRKPKGESLEERFLSNDRLLGQAVALTSDGWFVTHGSVIGQLTRSDLTLWHGGKSYPVLSAVSDRINGTVFLKVDARELTPPAFGDALPLLSSEEFWIESRTRVFIPTLVISLNDDVSAFETFSSEVVSRRLLLHGIAGKGEGGAPLWSSTGELMGIIESGAGEQVRALPVTSIATSFSSLLNSGTIRHASLGIRGVDVSLLRIEGERAPLPWRGVLLRDDRRLNKPAVIKDSAAAKAGLKAGDVILEIERDILDGTVDLGELLSEYQPNAPVRLRVWRDGKELDVPVTLGSIVTGEALK